MTTSGARPAFRVDTIAVADNLRILEIAGELDLTTAPDLDSVVALTVADGPVRLILDFTTTTFIDSSGLRSVLRSRDLAQASAARPMGLVVDDEQQRELLRLTGIDLDPRVKLFSSRAEALAPEPS